ncbi:hypothetical protein BDP27DRAFT_1483403 [Rhodocollybia butyracea]|uniref:Uncharacterized protein n=1 Tax=Rhodocollybia butyracea TaxID=206335 RepID=A0A9P5U1B1_9AGAR|nr:hypothetical protein BDP27DRAFT_1483403 [Rhodocollybia butyracea]
MLTQQFIRLLNQFVMMRTNSTSSSKYYAARVLSWNPSALVFTVEWYNGNCYSANDVPSASTIELDIGSVQKAFEEGTVIAQGNYGSIKWPIQLTSNAVDTPNGYENPEVTQALQEARNRILDIISGSESQTVHPIIDLFARWSHRNSKTMLDSFKDECFQYDLLPAGNSHAEEASAGLGPEVNGTLIADLIGGALSGLPMIKVLFDLVVIRVYFGKISREDGQIYHLARRYSSKELESQLPTSPHYGYLQRHLSLPESALAASQGSINRLLPPFAIDVYQHHIGMRHVLTSEDLILFPQGMQPITAHHPDGFDYIWLKGTTDDVFSMTGAQAGLSTTPATQITHGPPKYPPNIQPKSHTEDVNYSPLPHYNLRRNPQPSARQQSLTAGIKCCDSWDALDFVAEMPKEVAEPQLQGTGQGTTARGRGKNKTARGRGMGKHGRGQNKGV